MRVWRIFDHRTAWARALGADPLSGEGGMYGPGRWNHRGARIVYTAESASLAVLEILVRVPPTMFGARTLLELDVPDDLEIVSRTQLFRMIHDAPDAERQRLSRDYGSVWVNERRTLGLVVPSAVMPMERNVLLNPSHASMREVRTVSSEVITLDPRLFPEPEA